MFRWLRRLLNPCRVGLHRWSMPGGWCDDCGTCDRFFGGHESCGKTCRNWGGSCRYCGNLATKLVTWFRGPFGKPGPIKVPYCGSCSLKDALSTRGMMASVKEGEDYIIEEATK